MEYIRLSPIEKGLMEYYGHLPQHVLNIAARIDFDNTIDEDKMLQALRYTVSEVRFCRLRIHKNEAGEMVQYFFPGNPEKVDILDFSTSLSDADKYMTKETRTAFPNNILDVQLYNTKLLRVPKQKHILYFNVHHIIMDAYSVTYTLSFLMNSYMALVKGEPLPEYKNTILQDIDKSWEYFGSSKQEKDRLWWQEQFKAEPHFTSMNGLGSPEFVRNKNYGKAQTLLQRKKDTFIEIIPAALVNRVNEAAIAHNTSPQIYYLLALRTYLGKVSGTEDVCIEVSVARRSTIVQKHSGLDRSNNAIIRSAINGELSFSEALNTLSLVQRNTYRHADYLITDATKMLSEMHPVPNGCTYSTVFFTYQPYFDIAGCEVDFSASQVSTGVSGVPLYLNVMPLDSSANLSAYYQYGIGYTDPKKLKLFHAFMLRFIEAGLTHPEQSVNALYELTK